MVKLEFHRTIGAILEVKPAPPSVVSGLGLSRVIPAAFVNLDTRRLGGLRSGSLRIARCALVEDDLHLARPLVLVEPGVDGLCGDNESWYRLDKLLNGTAS